MFWRKKKPVVVMPEPKQRPGFFSTELELSRHTVTPEVMRDFLRRTFKRPAGEFKAYTPEGTAMDDMDSIKPVSDDDAFLPFTQVGWYASQGFIGYQMCALISQNWLVNKACSMPGRDAVRHGYDLTFNDGMEVDSAVKEKIKKIDRKYQIKQKMAQHIRKGRIFGISHALPVVDYGSPAATKKALELPFNLDGVQPGSYKGITLIDPYWITPELDHQAAVNPASLHFYEPTWWRVNGNRIHRSHLIIFRNGEVPDVLKPTYFYGGIPLTQQIAERVYASERTANEAPALALSKRTTVIHADLESALANQADFDARMQLWARYRDNYGIKVLGSEETAEQFDTSLADFDAVVMTQYQLVAAIAGVPATRLIETSPKGFNATGEYEESSYNQTLESMQENDADPLLERHHLLLMKSFLPASIAKPVAEWEPVAPLSAKEKAEINEINARTGASLSASGAIDGHDERQRIIADKHSGYNGIPDEVPEMPDQQPAQEKEPNV